MNTRCRCGGRVVALPNRRNGGEVVNVFGCQRCGKTTERRVRRSRLWFACLSADELAVLSLQKGGRR